MPESCQTCTVLVVDDDVGVLNIAMAILEDFGYETLGASSGLEALQVLATDGHRIDALFSDIMRHRQLAGPRLVTDDRDG